MVHNKRIVAVDVIAVSVDVAAGYTAEKMASIKDVDLNLKIDVY